jgi:hypothetical protein
VNSLELERKVALNILGQVMKFLNYNIFAKKRLFERAQNRRYASNEPKDPRRLWVSLHWIIRVLVQDTSQP